MSMPIQRQSEAFGIFDDGPRFARDRRSADLPQGLAGLVNSMGPRIQAGLLNTRQAGWHTPDYDPRVDGYGGDGYRPSRADFAEEDAENERRRNYPRGQGAPWNYDKYGDPDPDLENLEETADPDRFLPGGHVSYRQASRHPFDRAAARRQFLAFDWKPDPSLTGNERYRSALENGHSLTVDQDDDPRHGWNWFLHVPMGTLYDADGVSNPTKIINLVTGGGSRWNGLPGAYSGGHLPSYDHARQQAEQAYQELYPIGTNTGGHDSGTDYSDLNSYMRHLESMRRQAKDGECTCWEGYERVPGTEPCASGSCRKKSSLERLALPTDWSRVRSGPLIDTPLFEQDPEDPFKVRPYSGPHCPDCDRPIRWVSDPGCDHTELVDRYYNHYAYRVALAPDAAALTPQLPVGGGFQPGHRVGLDWRDRVIPGTVIANDGLVHIRWDEGQYTSEDPSEVHLL